MEHVGSVCFYTFVVVLHIDSTLLLDFGGKQSLVLKLYEAHKALSPKRTIPLYSTLLIGDLCAESVYKEYLSDNGKTLMLTAPRRSLEADYQILLHSVSALHENGNMYYHRI